MISFKKNIALFGLVLILIATSNSVFSQNNQKKESEIISLIISFQEKRYSNPTEAKAKIEEAISIAKSIDSKKSIVSTKILLGEYYDDNNNIKKALTQYTEAITIAKDIKDIDGIASCEYNLGLLYYKQNTKEKKEKAHSHFEQAIQFSKATKNNFLLAKSYNSASFTQYDLNKLDKAKEYSFKALKLFKSLNKENRIAQCYLSFARLYNKKDEFTKAINYLDSSLTIYHKFNNHKEINNALLIKSEIFFRQKKYTKAIETVKIVENDPKVMSDQKLFALELLYQINKSMNKPSASLDYLEETKYIQDSLFQLERNKMLQSVLGEVEARNKLETLEKEAEINELTLKQNKYWVWALVVLSILLLLVALVSFLFYRQNKLKSEREKIKLEQESLQLEQKLLRTQMNPHFIANSLAAIQGNIYKQDKEKSVTYLSKFAKLMRFILESSRKKEILLQKEIVSLENYLDLQKLLLEEKLIYTVYVSKELEPEEIKIPPMLIQPFVENAIVHGIELKTTPGKVQLFFEKENETLKVTITDDGLGRKKVNEVYKKRNSDHLSFSTNITNERIQKMNAETKETIYSSTKDIVANGKVIGTEVELILPMKYIY